MRLRISTSQLPQFLIFYSFLCILRALVGELLQKWIRYMEKIAWDETFSVGVRDLDAQHKQIVSLVNILIEMSDTEVDSEIISDTLTKMTQYAIDHFKTEEQYMLEYGYPEYSSQRKQHLEFKRKTVDLCMETMAHKVTVPTEIFTYLRLWWTNHILQEDMKYKKFFNDRGLK